MTLKLDGAIKSQLSARGTDWDGLGRFGLSGHAVSQDQTGQYGHYHFTDTRQFRGEISLSETMIDVNMSEHPKGRIVQKRYVRYATPRIENGKVVEYRTLKTKVTSSGVYFAADEYETPVKASSLPTEELTCDIEGRWNPNHKRVDMHGTQVSGMKRAKRARK
jgi:hypothetical protein